MSGVHEYPKSLRLPPWLVAVAALLLAAGALAGPIGRPAELIERLNAAGYGEIRDIEFDDGLWEVEVRRDEGRWVEIHVDPASGEIFDRHAGRPLLDAEAIRAALTAQGYREIKDLDRDGAIWEVDAINRRGEAVDLRVSGFDGRVLYEERDD